MREWAISAGLGDESIPNHIKIVYEPDCASLSIQHKISDLRRGKSAISRKDVTFIAATGCTLSELEWISIFKNGTKYLLIDAGGGTVDVSCHESMGDMKIKELRCPSGGNWGSGLIDDRFIDLLHEIFTEEWLATFKSMHSRSWRGLLESFRSSKHSFYSKHAVTEKVSSRRIHSVRLNADFIAFLEDQCHLENMKLEDVVADSVYSNDISLDGVHLNLSYNIWRNVLFQTVMTPILRHVAACLAAPEMSDCNLICLVGGLSASRYL